MRKTPQTLLEFIPILREGCQHSPSLVVCMDCRQALAWKLEHLFDLMKRRADAQAELDSLKSVMITLL